MPVCSKNELSLPMMATDKQTLLQGFMLAKWRVDPLKGQIRAPDGTRQHVGPRAMDVLLCLAQRPGETVERSIVFAEVWGEQPRSHEALTHCIGELRHALADKPENPEFLLTVPKRGYCLLAPVSEIDPALSSAANRSTAEEKSGFLARQLQDLRKRKVFQIVVGYPVLAWFLLQIVDILWEYLLAPLGAPAWLVPSFVVLLALGYPIAVFLAWAIDLTPDGVKITTDKDGKPPVSGLIVVGLGSVTLTAIALFAYFNAYQAPAQPLRNEKVMELMTSPIESSVAVLRFLNISANPALSHVGDGLTEELIHELTNLGSLKVAARTSVWPLSTSGLQTPEIARRLNVHKVLEGSIRASGDHIRVTAQLIDIDGFHVWSETYDRKLGDILSIQKEIAAKVASKLDPMLSADSETRLATLPTINSSAYDQYLQGRQYLRQPGNPVNLSNAQSLFEQAIDLDNRFPLAYAGLCETHLANYRLTRATEHFDRAELACHRAMTLDGGLAEVYTALGDLYRHSGQFDKAEQEYQTALAVNPTFEEANYGLGRSYQGLGRLKQAEATLRRSVKLEPGYWATYFGLGNFLFRHGRFEEAVPYFAKVTNLVPEYAGGFINMGSALYSLGDWDAAELAWDKSIELRPDSMAFQNMGTLHYYQLRYADAVAMHKKAIEISPSDHRAWGKLAAAERYVPGLESASQKSYEKAIELAESQLAINPDEAEDLSYLSAYLVNTGDMAAARDAASRALVLAPENPSVHYFAAILELHSGNNEQALLELANAAKIGYSVKLLEADPQFARLRNHDNFQALIDKNVKTDTT